MSDTEQVKAIQRLTELAASFDHMASDSEIFSKFSRVHEQIEHLRAIQQSSTNQTFQYDKTATRDSRQQRLAKSVEWFKENGGQLSNKLKVQHVGPEAEDFGIVALDKIDPDELLVSVPPTLYVSSASEHVSNSALAWLMKSKNIPPNMCLVMWLITQKLKMDSDQSFTPYIDSLPVRVRHVIYATPEFLNKMRRTHLCRKIIIRFVSIVRHYLILMKNITASRMKKNKQFVTNVTFDLFRWCTVIVQTRANTHFRHSLSKTANGTKTRPETPSPNCIVLEDIALCPIIDFFNHETGVDKKALDATSGYYTLAAMRSFSAGQEVTMHYSALSNTERFVEQGFWPRDTEQEEQAVIPLTMIPPAKHEEQASDDCKCCDHGNSSDGFANLFRTLMVQKISYNEAGLVFTSKPEVRPHNSARNLAAFNCFSVQDQSRLIEALSNDNQHFDAAFDDVVSKHPGSFERDVYIFLHKSIENHLRYVHSNLDQNDDVCVKSDNGGNEEAVAWRNMLSEFFCYATQRNLEFMERCKQHCKDAVRVLVKQSLELNKQSARRTDTECALNVVQHEK